MRLLSRQERQSRRPRKRWHQERHAMPADKKKEPRQRRCGRFSIPKGFRFIESWPVTAMHYPLESDISASLSKDKRFVSAPELAKPLRVNGRCVVRRSSLIRGSE